MFRDLRRFTLVLFKINMPRENERSFDKLLNQLNSLIHATESNNELSKAIFNEVTTKDPGSNFGSDDASTDFETASRRVTSRLTDKLKSETSPRSKSDGKKLLRMIKSQSQLLTDHKKILSEVESASKELQKEKGFLAGRDSPRFTVDLKSLIEQFTDGLSEYQNLVSVLVHQNSHIQKDLRSKLYVRNSFSFELEGSLSPAVLEDINFIASRIENVNLQYQVIEKEIQYVRKLVKKQLPVSPSEQPPRTPLPTKGEDLPDLDFYIRELENSRSLVNVLTKEIEVLQASMASILDESTEAGSAQEKGPINLLHRQVKELRTVWSHEVSANSVLRSLITKSQADRLKADETSYRRYTSLKEEFDELAELFEVSRKEVEVLKSDIQIREKQAQDAAKLHESELSKLYLQLHDSDAHTDEVADKERRNMSQLIKTLEAERDQLLKDREAHRYRSVPIQDTSLEENPERMIILEKRLETEREISELARKRVSELERKLGNLEKDNYSLSTECRDFMEKISELEAKRDGILGQTAQTFKQINEDLLQLRSSISNLAEKDEDLSAEDPFLRYQQLIQDIQSKVLRLKEDSQTSSGKVILLQKDYDLQNERLADLQSNLVKMQMSPPLNRPNETAKSELYNLREKFDQVKAALQDSELTIERLTEEIRVSNASHEKILKENSKLSQEQQELARELRMAQLETNQFKDKYSAATESQENLLRDGPLSWTEERARITEQLLQASEEIARLTQSLTQKQEELQVIQQLLEDQRPGLQQALLKQQRAFEQDIASLLEEKQNIEQSLGLREMEWEEERKRLNALVTNGRSGSVRLDQAEKNVSILKM